MALCDPLFSPALMAPAKEASYRGPLHAGATWEGLQKSGRKEFRVKVTLLNVDMAEGKVDGLLQIKGLTPQLAVLTTFFEGEICGLKNGFVTGRWGATEKDDLQHWSRFLPFRGLRPKLAKPNLTYDHYNKDFVFMRFKEAFVVPDHKVSNIHGASFAGFYYLLCDMSGSMPPAPAPLPSPRLPSRSSFGASTAPPIYQRALSPPISPSSQVPPSVRRPAPPSSPPLPASHPPQAPGSPPPRSSTPRRSVSYAAAVRGESPSSSGSSEASTSSSPPSTPTRPQRERSSEAAAESSAQAMSLENAKADPEDGPSAAADAGPQPIAIPAPSARGIHSSAGGPGVALPFQITDEEFPPPPHSPVLGSTSPISDRPSRTSSRRASFRGPASGSSAPNASQSRDFGRRWTDSIDSSLDSVASSIGNGGGLGMSLDGSGVVSSSSMPASGGAADSSVGRGRDDTSRLRRASESGYASGARTPTAGNLTRTRSGGGAGVAGSSPAHGPPSSWDHATMAGFYFHSSSQPFQELSLKYAANKRGGSETFSFR